MKPVTKISTVKFGPIQTGRDTGIDLVAKTQGTEEIHAIQCKFYAPEHRVMKGDIDSFFTASGKKPFSRRIIVTVSLRTVEIVKGLPKLDI